MTEDGDARLVRRFQQGDLAAFEQFVVRHQERMFRLSMMNLNNPADAADATQELFLRSLNGLRRFRFRAEPATWLFRTMKYVCHEFNRRQQRDTSVTEAAEQVDRAPGIDRLLDDNRTAARIRKLVAGLPERQRDVVLLRTFEELSVEDTARTMGCRPGTVKALYHKAIANLRLRAPGNLLEP